MDILRFVYSSNWRLRYIDYLVAIAVIYLVLGLCAIQTTELSNSVPAFAMSLFKSFFTMFTVYSASHGWLLLSSVFAVSSQLERPSADTYLVYSALKFLHLVLFLYYCSSIAIPHFFPRSAIIFDILVFPLAFFLQYQRIWRSQWIDLLRRLLNSYSHKPFVTWLRIYMSDGGMTNLINPLSTAAAGTEQENNNSIFSRNKKIVRKIKFAVGMTVSILFQNYFRLKSFEEIVAFLWIAVSWLASITLLSVSNDFGVFNFILGNVIVGSMVAEAGLGALTWITFAASLLLYLLLLQLQSFPLIHGRRNFRVPIVVFILLYLVVYGLYLLQSRYRTCRFSDLGPLSSR